MNYWLIKTEPRAYSIDDLAKDKKTPWTGVRNFQARNFMRDQMTVGNRVLFYHSGVERSIMGIARVSSQSQPDPTQFVRKSPYYEPRATNKIPIWYMVTFSFVKKFKKRIPLSHLKIRSDLAGMELLRRGSRLSIQPVSEKNFKVIETLESL